MSKHLNQSSQKAFGRLLVSAKRNLLGLAVLAGLAGASSAFAQTTFFNWGLNTPTNANAPIDASTMNVFNVTDGNVSQVVNLLTQAANNGQTLAIKVDAGVSLSQSTINTLFNTSYPNGKAISYVFADYEGPSTSVTTSTANLVSSLQANANANTALTANSLHVGNFALAPIPGNDPTSNYATSSTYTSGNASNNNYMTSVDFSNAHVNMATESLYPGDATFRNPVFGNSTAPNLRSVMFTLPIQRLSLVQANLAAGQVNIPYITRFNNFANSYMANTTVARTDNVGTQNALDTSGAALQFGNHAAVPVAGQLLSRDDFQALVLHYRMRGAAGYSLLDPGVQGYTQQQFESDASTGWNNSIISTVLGGTNGRPATLVNTIGINGSTKTTESAGVVWSAVTNDNASGVQLAVLVSNLTDSAQNVNLNGKINGATLSYSGTVQNGLNSHQILRFTKSGSVWSIVGGPTPAFNDASLASRDGIGIPEPTSLSLLGLGGLGLMCRRRRRD